MDIPMHRFCGSSRAKGHARRKWAASRLGRLYPRARRAAIVCLVLVLLFGCAPQSSTLSPQSLSASQPSPKRIAIAIKGDPPTLSDKINSAGAGGVPGVAEVERLISAGLAITDDRGALRPQLAEAVPSSENGLWKVGPDGRMETIWGIRADARWHDGTPVTAQDLAFTARVGQDRELPHFSDRAFGFLEGVEILDSRTIVARWKQPYIEAGSMFTHAHALPLPAHLLERTYVDNKAGFVEVPYWTQEFVGTGPFRLREWVAGSHMVLSASDSYVGVRPKLDEIEVKFIPDPNTLIANILAGAVDLTMGRGLSIEQVASIEEQRKDVKVEVSLGGCLCAFPQFLNANPPAVGNVQFRRALLHATDRQQLATTLQMGLVPAAHVFVTPNQAEYRAIEASVVRYEYDLLRAAQLIEGLGYTRGADGIYRDAAGQRLGLEMRTTAGVEVGKNLLFAIADSWQRIGVAAEPVVIPPQRSTDREYRANFPAFDLVNQPSNLTLLQRFTSAEAALPENNYRGNNRTRYMSAELDGFIDRYFSTIPLPERMQAAAQAINHLTDRVIVMPMLYNANAAVVSSRLANVTAENIGWNADQWELRG